MFRKLSSRIQSVQRARTSPLDAGLISRSRSGAGHSTQASWTTVNAIRPSVSQSVLLRFFGQLIQHSFSFRIVLLLERDEIAGANTSVSAHPTEGNLSPTREVRSGAGENIEHVRCLLSRELGLHRNDGDGAAVRHLPQHFQEQLKRFARNDDGDVGPPIGRPDLHRLRRLLRLPDLL